MSEWLQQWLGGYGLGETLAVVVAHMLLIVAVVLVSWAAAAASRRVLLRVGSHLIQRSRIRWDDALLEAGLFHRLAQFAPAVVIYLFASAFGEFRVWIERLALLYMLTVGVRAVDALFGAGLRIYQAREISREKPIQGYVQLARLALYLIGTIFFVATLLQRDPWGLLTGLGAMSAVLLLVFRDSILGFVASVQLASNDMVRRGDWIEMPQYGADGDVIEVSLHTVKVRNWDKTVSTIPTHALINDSFKNWRGMAESGGRRIKRAVHIDISTIQLCDDEMLRRFEKFELIHDYVRSKRAEIESYNRERGLDTSQLINVRRLTNVGTFRAYVVEYLRQHPKIHSNMTFLVRQLAPTELGLPIEIYVFSNDQVWANYEAIQADIFDHILAVVPQFDLRVYQSPSAGDLLAAARVARAAS